MAKTPLILETIGNATLTNQVRSGRYASADDVVREALKGLQDQDRKLADVLQQLDQGRQQAEGGQFAEDDFLDRLIEADS